MQFRQPTATVNIDIGEAFSGLVGTWTVGVQGIGGGNIAPQGVLIGTLDGGVIPAQTYVACGYKKDSDLTTVAAGTNITTDGIYYVPSTGKLIRLVFTFSAGTPIVWWHPSAGSV